MSQDEQLFKSDFSLVSVAGCPISRARCRRGGDGSLEGLGVSEDGIEFISSQFEKQFECLDGSPNWPVETMHKAASMIYGLLVAVPLAARLGLYCSGQSVDCINFKQARTRAPSSVLVPSSS